MTDNKRKIPRQQSLVEPDIGNPFVHNLHLGPLDMLKVGLMSITIAPLRLILVGVCLLLAWPLAAVACGFRSAEEKNRPLTGWRKSIGSPLTRFGRLMAFSLGFQNIKVKGQPVASKEAPMLCVAPHSSFLDPLVLFYCSSLPTSVSREENSHYFLISALLAFTQPVLVKREDPDSRANTVKEIKRRAKTGGQWPQIIIFPEGTCTNRTCLISFKPGAFYPGVPVQPVCLRYPNRLDTVTWTWEGPGVFALLWLTLCQFQTNLEIEFLPVYHPNEEEKRDPKLFSRNVRATMAKCLGVPITDHTFDDCRLMMTAHKLNLPMKTGIVEFQKLHQKLGVSLQQMEEWLNSFCSIDKKHTGKITVEQFSKYLQVPVSPSLQEVFNLYDRDGSGSIDFREYVIGLSLVSAPVNNDQTISLAFQLFDTGNKGYISHDELAEILNKAFNMTEMDSSELFDLVDRDQDGRITFQEFKEFSEQRPEYASLFHAYQESQKDSNGNGRLSTVEEEEDDLTKLE